MMNITLIFTSEHTGIYGNHDAALTLPCSVVVHSSCNTCLNTTVHHSTEPLGRGCLQGGVQPVFLRLWQYFNIC